MTLDQLINDIIAKEGGYVNHPDDRGGPTNFGITLAEFRRQRNAQATINDLRAMQRSEAYDIYYRIYYVAPGFDKIGTLSARIANEITDTGVNMGTHTASVFLQRALNVLNRKGTIYPDIAVDGKVGPGTAKALHAFLSARGSEGEVVFLRALNCLQGARYIELAEAREANESFVYGWLANRVGL